jgi:hypothetical protein
LSKGNQIGPGYLWVPWDEVLYIITRGAIVFISYGTYLLVNHE